MRTILFILFAALIFTHPAHGTLPPLERLTPLNLHRLEQVGVIQRGTSEEIAWSPDETRIAVIGSAGLRLYTLETGGEQILFGHAGGVNDVDFSPDGRDVVSAGDDGTLRIWNSESGQLRRILIPYEDLNCACRLTSVKYAANAESLWVGAENGPLRVIDLQTGAAISEDPRRVLEIVAEPTRSRFAIIEQRSSLLTVWPASGVFAPVATIDMRFTVWNAAFVPQTPYVLVAGFVGANLTVVDTATLEHVRTVAGSRVLHVNSLGSIVTQVIDWFGNVRRVSMRVSTFASTALQFNRIIPVELTDARFSPSGDLVAASDSDGRITVWHWRYNQQLLNVLPAGSALIGVAVLNNGLVASIDSGIGVVQTLTQPEILSGSTVRLWDIASGRDAGVFNTADYGLESADMLYWDARINRLIVGSTKHTDIQLQLDPVTGDIRHVGTYNVLFLADLQYMSESPDGLLAAEAMSNDDVRLRDSINEANSILLRDSGPALSFTPDGTMLLTAGPSGAIRVWGVRATIPAAD